MAPAAHWLDQLTAVVAPRFTLKRQRARLALDLLARHYEGAAPGRRTQGWPRRAGDANAVIGPALSLLRQHARDLVRNNSYAASAVETIADHTCGWGIVAKPAKTVRPAVREAALARWKPWAETAACDADGRHDLVGLQKLVMTTVVEAGEALIRRRRRRAEDGLPLPIQIQVLEPDFLDTLKDNVALANGGRIVQGVEFDALDHRVAYWLFPEHPGATTISVRGFGASQRIPAENVLHVFKAGRPGQVRGPSWFGPVILRMKDFDEYEDATLLKQKIAACLAVILTDVDGAGTALGKTDPDKPEQDGIEPGMIVMAPPGRSVEIVEPPSVAEYDTVAAGQLRAIATGLGVTFEDLTGNYAGMPFSAARMSRLRHWSRVEGWRWRMLIPQFLDPVWGWAMEAAMIGGLAEAPPVEWTAPPAPMIEPDREGLAYQRNIRGGLMTLSEAIRERGYDPDDLLGEMAADWKKLDQLGLILDSDPRKTTQAGQPRDPAKAAATAPAEEADRLLVSPNGGGH